MKLCSVCSNPNDDFSVICSACGSYIQDRVPNLDFFSTVWQIIESPSAAFSKIIRSDHKNYVLLLFGLAGIAQAFALMFLHHTGNAFDNVLYVMLFGVGVGVIGALPVGIAGCGLVHAVTKLFGGTGSFRNSYAAIGWAMVPVALGVVFVLPIELASMGLYLFTTGPSSFELKPIVMIALGFLDVASFIWTIVLAAKGIGIVHRIRFRRALVAVSLWIAVMAFGVDRLFTSLF